MGAGAEIEVVEEPDGVKLKLVRGVGVSDVSALAGMVWARVHGDPRSFGDFDAASLITRQAPKPRDNNVLARFFVVDSPSLTTVHEATLLPESRPS